MKKLWVILALVVGLLVHSPPTHADTISVPHTFHDAAVATGEGVQLYVENFNTVGFYVNITNTATVSFKTTGGGVGNDSTFGNATCVRTSDTTGTLVVSTTTSGSFQCNVAGMKWFKTPISAFTSGTVTVTGRTSSTIFSGGGSGGMSGAATAVAPTLTEGSPGSFSFDLNGNVRVAPGTLQSGEDQANNLMMTSGGKVRAVTMMTGVTTNTTGVATAIFSGGKTGIARVSGTGAVTATLNLYGDFDSTLTTNNLVCTITLSATTVDIDVCSQGQWTIDFPSYHAVSSNVTGTGATVEFIVAVGATGSVAGGGGAVTNAGTFVVQENGAALTALQLIDNMISGSGVNVSQKNGVTPLMGAGNTGTGSDRVTEATDSQLSAGVGATGDAAATAGSTGSLAAKQRLMTSQLDTISTAIAAIQTAVQLIDDDQTGSSIQHHISVGTTEDETEIKATAGRIMSISATNTNAAARYLRCANLTAANTTPGTSAVFWGIALPAGGGIAMNFAPSGLAFSTALTCWVVTGVAETDVAEVAANEINWNIGYK